MDTNLFQMLELQKLPKKFDSCYKCMSEFVFTANIHKRKLILWVKVSQTGCWHKYISEFIHLKLAGLEWRDHFDIVKSHHHLMLTT